jgi:X-X-X-Leu-X-X-Gly heptad repeat protein
MGNATLGTIREGGSPGSVTTGASELAQKAADVATGVGGKKLEDVAK